MNRRNAGVLLAACVLLLGCTRTGTTSSAGMSGAPAPSAGPVSPPPTAEASWEAPPSAPAAAPVDPAIAPLSRSALSADARAALDACGGSDRGLGAFARMGLVPSAGTVPHYVRLTATAPQLSQDPGRPAWVVEFAGDWPDPMTGQSWIDATCVVIGQDAVFYATGPIRDLTSGRIVRGYYAVDPLPDRSLPEMLP